MTLLRNNRNLNTGSGAHRSRLTVFERVNLCWTILLLSALLDPFLSTILIPRVKIEVAYSAALLCIGVIIPLLDQHRWQRALGFLRSMHKRSLTEKASFASTALIAVVVIASLVKGLFFAASFKGLLGMVFALFLLVALVQATLKGLAERKQEREQFTLTPRSQIERWEEQLLILSVAPMVVARIISGLGVLSAFPVVDWPQRLPFFLLGFILMVMLQPERRTFQGICPRCKQPVPRVLVEMGSCYRCNEGLRGE